MKSSRAWVLGIALMVAAASQAQVKVDAVWVRPTVPGQQAAGGYLSLNNAGGAADRLIGGSTPVAARLELHTMSMEGDVMRMRQVDAIDVPAGKTIDLKPGGLHLMLMGLKAPLKVGDKLPLRLKFEKAGTVDVEATVMVRAAPAGTHKH